METSKIKFKKSNLAAYKGIVKPGRYELQIASDVTPANRVADEDGKNPRYIANLKAIALDKFEQVKQVFEGKEEVELEQLNGLFLTANVWERENRTPDLPMKGETVDCTIDMVEDREGNAVLRVTNIKRKAAEVATAFSFDSVAQTTAAKSEEATLVH